ncbi:MAG: RHS repeat-associated core domain-containing protein, partial [Fimbriimonadaceae bacterium]|nr:RHS repeat-associated core domain-containing protein [Fimbriimonadaceae bacterium]
PSTPAGFGGQLGYYRDQRERLYVRARHYRPGRGRWMSRDPLGDGAGWAAMVYVRNNPLQFVDPTGLMELDCEQYRAEALLCRQPAHFVQNRSHCDRLRVACPHIYSSGQALTLQPAPYGGQASIREPSRASLFARPLTPSSTSIPLGYGTALGYDTACGKFRFLEYEDLWPTAPTLKETLWPVYGSLRMADYHLSRGHYGRSIFWTGMGMLGFGGARALLSVGWKAGRSTLWGVPTAVTEELAEARVRAVTANTAKHFTLEESLGGIRHTSRQGSQWGIFITTSERASGRFVGARGSDAVVVLHGELGHLFAKPPRWGLASSLRYLSGAASTPLWSVVYRSTSGITERTLFAEVSHFAKGEIFRQGVFRQATEVEYGKYLLHQWLLDYGLDSLIYSGCKAVGWGKEYDPLLYPPF